MGIVTTTDGTDISHQDPGTGQPVVLSHGRPLNAGAFNADLLEFLAR
jgi:hypothetical protein